MKEMKKIAEGKNFTACDFGKLNDLGGYVLQLGDIKIPGKVFGGQAVGATGGDFSFQTVLHAIGMRRWITSRLPPTIAGMPSARAKAAQVAAARVAGTCW